MNRWVAYAGWIAAAAIGALHLAGVDDNAQARYGEKSGLPVNCRAYVESVVQGYRSRSYSADDSIAGLDRNCGANGQLWKKH